MKTDPRNCAGFLQKAALNVVGISIFSQFAVAQEASVDAVASQAAENAAMIENTNDGPKATQDALDAAVLSLQSQIDAIELTVEGTIVRHTTRIWNANNNQYEAFAQCPPASVITGCSGSCGRTPATDEIWFSEAIPLKAPVTIYPLEFGGEKEFTSDTDGCYVRCANENSQGIFIGAHAVCAILATP